MHCMEGDPLPLVLDTNIVLDLWVYEDPATAPLRLALADPKTLWLTSGAMREELARVLGYPQIVKRLKARAVAADSVLAQFDQRARTVPAAAKAPYTCKDEDDQKFIDLAAAHGAILISKDAEVLCMARRLAKLGATVVRAWPADGVGRHLAASAQEA
jgi:putative PIN family toxin of toxin-antitoxin system